MLAKLDVDAAIGKAEVQEALRATLVARVQGALALRLVGGILGQAEVVCRALVYVGRQVTTGALSK